MMMQSLMHPSGSLSVGHKMTNLKWNQTVVGGQSSISKQQASSSSIHASHPIESYQKFLKTKSNFRSQSKKLYNKKTTQVNQVSSGLKKAQKPRPIKVSKSQVGLKALKKQSNKTAK